MRRVIAPALAGAVAILLASCGASTARAPLPSTGTAPGSVIGSPAATGKAVPSPKSTAIVSEGWQVISWAVKNGAIGPMGTVKVKNVSDDDGRGLFTLTWVVNDEAVYELTGATAMETSVPPGRTVTITFLSTVGKGLPPKGVMPEFLAR